jgi:signal transduction histidine kinase
MAKVLVVDDERNMRFILTEFLTSGGHEVVSADSVPAACAILREGSIDVVVTDIILPGQSGLELLRIVRDMGRHIQVLLITGVPTVETAADAMRNGATDYLVKPITKPDILRAVGLAARVKALEDMRAKLEEADRLHSEQLELLVQRRTRELSDTNAQLAKAMEELKNTQMRLIEQERLNAIGQMASGIAHDFNNILMPILGYSEMLLSDSAVNLTQKEKETALHDIYEAAKEAKEIVRRMRELYRPKEEVPLQTVNVRGLMERISRLTEPAWRTQAQAEGRPIKLLVSADESIAVTGNEASLCEALTNLVLNSVDAMPTGGTIDLMAETRDDRAIISVKDTGSGMPEEVRRRCTDPFFSTKGDRGTGLGLSICYGVVRRHDGQMEVVSAPGQGTTIRISLPLASRPAPQEAAAKTEAVGRKWRRALIVDDDSRTRSTLARYLDGVVKEVVLASSGREAVDILGRQSFDLVVTDRAMPDINGDDVAKAAKKASPGTPVVMLTGFGDLMHASMDLPDGVDRILSKPVTAFELMEALAALDIMPEVNPDPGG